MYCCQLTGKANMIFESTNITTVGMVDSCNLNLLLISLRLCTLEPRRPFLPLQITWFFLFRSTRITYQHCIWNTKRGRKKKNTGFLSLLVPFLVHCEAQLYFFPLSSKRKSVFIKIFSSFKQILVTCKKEQALIWNLKA